MARLVLVAAALLAVAVGAAALQGYTAEQEAELRDEIEFVKETLKVLETSERGRKFSSSVAKFMDDALTIDKSAVALDPDATRTICEAVIDKGFECERIVHQTRDGFNLITHRMYARNYTNGPAVLLSHGLIDSGGSWILYPPNTPGHSLSYQLAARGYDVWLGAVRNTRYGETHEEYERLDRELWAQTFDEQGYFDVPDSLDLIMQVGNHSKVAVVGHSQGTTQILAGLGQAPQQLAPKMSVFVALAPAGYFNYLENEIFLFLANAYIGELLWALGVRKMIYLPDWLLAALPYMCQTFPGVTYSILSALFGDNPGAWVDEKLGVMCSHSPGWTSMHNMIHWAQLIRNRLFQGRDYYSRNMEEWGTPNPPLYDLSKLWPSTLPIAIFHGGNDDLAPYNDVLDVIADLPKAAVIFTKLIPEYAHCDFHWGKDSPTLIYADTINIISRYTGGQGW